MQYTRKLAILSTALLCAAAITLAGCGDDDDTPGATNAGPDSQAPDITTPDGGGGDGGDGGCTFNDFVTGLINNSTTATALPSTDLGDKCTDEQKLFPQTIF